MAPPGIRAQLLAMYDVVWQLGSLVGFWINYAASVTLPLGSNQWIIPFAIQFIPGGLLFVGTFSLNESPRWLMMNGNTTAGLANLRWFRNLNHDDPILARLALSTILFVWQNSSGINAVNYYSPTIFQSLGIGGTDAKLLSTGIFGVIKACSTFLWMVFLVESWGRRRDRVLISSGSDGPAGLDPGGRAAMAFFYIWTVFYSASWNWTPWVINAEIFDQNIRTFVQAINASANWFWSFIMARFTPQMFASMSFGVYFLFASLSMIGFCYVFLLIPETKGLPLEMMDNLFTKGVPAWKAHDYVLNLVDELEHNYDGTISTTAEQKEQVAHVDDV
ncbi:general substrate transporter [Lipomyces japonicus]|uniref:general substrate transporter n=1 Tax=Lipomyces japonicus TaxID=56871 RepID=UPI0034CD8E3E